MNNNCGSAAICKRYFGSVTLSRSSYLSMFVGSNNPDATCRSVSTNSVRPDCGCIRNIIPTHCAGVTNMSLIYNLSPAVKIYRRHRRMSSGSASQTKTTDLLFIITNYFQLSRSTTKPLSSVAFKQSRVNNATLIHFQVQPTQPCHICRQTNVLYTRHHARHGLQTSRRLQACRIPTHIHCIMDRA